jgi:hypothetical protein
MILCFDKLRVTNVTLLNDFISVACLIKIISYQLSYTLMLYFFFIARRHFAYHTSSVFLVVFFDSTSESHKSIKFVNVLELFAIRVEVQFNWLHVNFSGQVPVGVTQSLTVSKLKLH